MLVSTFAFKFNLRRYSSGSPDGTRLACASGDGTVRMWDINTGRQVAMLEKLQGHTLEEQQSCGVWSCVWSSDGMRLASTSSDETLCVWLAPAMRPIPTGDGANDANANVPGLSPEAAMRHLRRHAEAEEQRSAAERAAHEAERGAAVQVDPMKSKFQAPCRLTR